MRRRLHVNIRRWCRKILSLDDTPESIAASVGIGIFVAWTPTIGLQMVITFALCTVARVNRIAGPLMAWLTNPLTIVPIFSFNYLAGRMLVPSTVGSAEVRSRMAETFERLSTISIWDFLLFHWEKLKFGFGAFLGLGVEILVPLIVGSIVVGAVLGMVSYPLTLRAVRRFRAGRARRAGLKSKETPQPQPQEQATEERA